MVRRREEDTERGRVREEDKEGEIKSTVQSKEGVAVWGFSADWTEVWYSKWWRGVGAAVQRVRPAGDSASTTRCFLSVEGGSLNSLWSLITKIFFYILLSSFF